MKLAATITGSLANAFLAILKLYVGLISNSISILSDGINNFCDMFGFIGASIGFAVSDKKPTERFPFGFGRVENIVSLLISVLILVIGGLFCYESLERVFMPLPITFNWTHFALIAVSIPVKVGLAVFFYIVDKKSDSPVIKVEKLDCILDVSITTTTLLGFGLSQVTSLPIDGVIGVAVACVVVVTGIKLIAKNFATLIGRKYPEKESSLKELSDKFDANVTDIKIFDYGNKVFAVAKTDSEDENKLSEIKKESLNKLGIELYIDKGENYGKEE